MLAVQYDSLLVALSVVVAMMASFTGIALTTGGALSRSATMKTRVMNGALVIGGGIWSMHFIGMLAVELPVAMQYDVLETLTSLLAAVLLTGLGLYIVAFQPFRRLNVPTAGLFMGLGIAGMHYLGMSAMRGGFTLDYSLPGVALSVAIGVLASMGAMWFAFRRRTLRQTMMVGVVLGATISAMHYTAMFATAFIAIEAAQPMAAPALSTDTLAILVALPAFVICGLFLLVSLPDKTPTTDSAIGQDANRRTGPRRRPVRVPVHKNGTLRYLRPEEIVSVSAQGHYTVVCDATAQYFCDYSISALEHMLGPDRFIRSHRSHLVNFAYVAGIGREGDRGFLVVKPASTEHHIPVSRSKLEAVRMRLEGGFSSGA